LAGCAEGGRLGTEGLRAEVLFGPSPCPSAIGWERGRTIWGGVTQGGTRINSQ